MKHERSTIKKKIFTVSRIKPVCIIILFLESIKQATNKQKEHSNITNKWKVIFLHIYSGHSIMLETFICKFYVREWDRIFKENARYYEKQLFTKDSNKSQPETYSFFKNSGATQVKYKHLKGQKYFRALTSTKIIKINKQYLKKKHDYFPVSSCDANL